MLDKTVTYSTTSDQATLRIGHRLGALLAPGDVLGVTGALGSGKTWFAKGVGRGLGIPERTVITSPSFSLVNAYETEGRIAFYHMDLYRLSGLEEVLSAGLEEYLHSEGVVLVEWADRCPDILPPRALSVAIAIEGAERRRIALSGGHTRADQILEGMPPPGNGVSSF